MVLRRFSVVGVGATLVGFAGCVGIYGDLDELEQQVAVHESSPPSELASEQYAVGFGFGGNSSSGLDVIAVGNSDGGIALLSFDRSGTFSSTGLLLGSEFALATRPSVASLPEENSVVVGMRRTSDDSGFLALFAPTGLPGAPDGINVPSPPTGVALGRTIFAADGSDAVAVGGDQLTIVNDYASSPVAISCALPGVTNVAVADFVDGGDLEIAIVDGTSFAVFTTAESPLPETCPAPSSPVVLDSDGGESFAENIAVGDFDGNGAPDVAVSHHLADRVYVVMNPDGSSAPTVETVSGSQGTLFGTSIATGDLDGDGIDELIVGASLAESRTVAQAGAIHIIGFNGTAFAVVADVFRADPETGEVFGRAVGVGTFANGRDVLLSAANGVAFVYFRDPLGAPDPRAP